MGRGVGKCVGVWGMCGEGCGKGYGVSGERNGRGVGK